MSLLLLGATGFLGRRVSRRLEADRTPFIRASRSLGTDLRERPQFRRLFLDRPDIDQIIHAAAFIGGIRFGLDHPAEIFYNNTLINLNLYELAREFGVKRIINPIPNCSYPRDVYPEFKEEHWWDGPLEDSVRVYGLVRKASYVQSIAYHQQYGVETINLVIPNMYGPGDHFDETRSHALGALVMKIVEAERARTKQVVIWGTGKPVREWLYVDDCVEAVLRSLALPYYAEPINIGIGMGISIRELAEIIKRDVGYEGELIYDTMRPDGAPYKVMNVDRCRALFGWQPGTQLPQGLKATLAWYRNKKCGR